MRPILRYAAPPGVWLALALCPAPPGLPAPAWHYLGLFVAVIAALIAEPLPAPAVGLIGVTVAVVLGAVAPTPAGSIAWGLSGFAEPVVWLIFGASAFARGYERTGLGRRIALTLVRALGGRALGLGYAVTLADLLVAPFTPSNTARSAGIIYPILRNIPPLYDSYPGRDARKIGGYLMWTAFAATAVTSSLFLTALAPNLLAAALIRRATDLDISWARWTLGVLPVGLVLLGMLPLLVFWIYPPEVRASREVPAWAAGELARMGRMSAREGAMVVLIGLTFALWIFGRRRIDPTAVGLVAVGLMLAGGLIAWDDIAGDRDAWGVLVYFATMMTLSDGLHRVGVIAWASGAIAGPLGALPPRVALVLLVAAFYLAHYLFASLTAHTTALLPVILAAGSAIEGMPVRALALLSAYAIGLMGVLTPYATGPAPVYYGSGYLPRRDFWLLGLAFGAIFLVALLAIGLPGLLLLGA